MPDLNTFHFNAVPGWFGEYPICRDCGKEKQGGIERVYMLRGVLLPPRCGERVLSCASCCEKRKEAFMAGEAPPRLGFRMDEPQKPQKVRRARPEVASINQRVFVFGPPVEPKLLPRFVEPEKTAVA